MSDFCQCGIPQVSGDQCERCGKGINPQSILFERLHSLRESDSYSKDQGIKESDSYSKNRGLIAAQSVSQYAILFEKTGLVLQILNTIGAVVLLILLVVEKPAGAYFILGIVAIGLLWLLSYLQTSLVRGLAAYFQMRSIDYVERRTNV